MKLRNFGHFRQCGTGTTLFGTGTIHIMYGGTDTCTDWVLLGGTGTTLFWYRYHFVVLPRIASFSLFWYHLSSYNFSLPYYLKTNMEFIQNHFTTLELVTWNFIKPNPR